MKPRGARGTKRKMTEDKERKVIEDGSKEKAVPGDGT